MTENPVSKNECTINGKYNNDDSVFIIYLYLLENRT